MYSYCQEMGSGGQCPADIKPIEPDGLPSLPDSAFKGQRESAARRRDENEKFRRNGSRPGPAEQAVFSAAKERAIRIGRTAGRSSKLSPEAKRVLGFLVNADYNLVPDTADPRCLSGDISGYAVPSENGIFICTSTTRDTHQREEGMSQAAFGDTLQTMIHEAGHLANPGEPHDIPGAGGATHIGGWRFHKEFDRKHVAWLYGDFSDVGD